jgi:hypothetical protein
MLSAHHLVLNNHHDASGTALLVSLQAAELDGNLTQLA